MSLPHTVSTAPGPGLCPLQKHGQARIWAILSKPLSPLPEAQQGDSRASHPAYPPLPDPAMRELSRGCLGRHKHQGLQLSNRTLGLAMEGAPPTAPELPQHLLYQVPGHTPATGFLPVNPANVPKELGVPGPTLKMRQ